MTRVIGFEIMPAPFVITHWQIATLLKDADAPLDDETGERAAVYLTNALTGWEPADPNRPQLPIAELEEERGAAEAVKRERPILVILGNPPYNAFAGTSPAEEHGLVGRYKQGLITRWGVRKFNLDDMYIRFFRIAERRIAERTGRGVVSFITNHSWLGGKSFVVMRQSLLRNFDRFWIENMHGDRKITEYGPDGRTSETIFAVPGYSVGIRQGVAISLMCRTGQPQSEKYVLFRDDINASKASERREQLLRSLNDADFDAHYMRAQPTEANMYLFRPATVPRGYGAWPKLNEIGRIAP
jgi:predicted helicase